LQIVEFDPNTLVKLGTLDKLSFAAMQRDVKDLDAIAAVTGAPENNLGR